MHGFALPACALKSVSGAGKWRLPCGRTGERRGRPRGGFKLEGASPLEWELNIASGCRDDDGGQPTSGFVGDNDERTRGALARKLSPSTCECRLAKK